MVLPSLQDASRERRRPSTASWLAISSPRIHGLHGFPVLLDRRHRSQRAGTDRETQRTGAQRSKMFVGTTSAHGRLGSSAKRRPGRCGTPRRRRRCCARRSLLGTRLPTRGGSRQEARRTNTPRRISGWRASGATKTGCPPPPPQAATEGFWPRIATRIGTRLSASLPHQLQGLEHLRLVGRNIVDNWRQS